MKENKKKNVLSGAMGAAAGVAGAVGASELNDWLKENEENELDDELDDAVAANAPAEEEVEEEDIEVDIFESAMAQNTDSDEIMPVDSGGMGQIGEGNEVAMIDVDPDEIAQEIVGEPMDEENLMASHGSEDAPDADIDALFDDEEADPVIEDEDLAGTEFEEEEEFEDLDEDVADADAEPDADVMDDMVDDIG